MPTQAEKANHFLALHRGPGAFLIANAWDASSARLLAGLGFPALATSSAAAAAIFGRHDGQITREEALAHARAVVAATDLPVSADLEDGFGADPATVAETVRLAAEAGLVGCLIQDTTGDEEHPLHKVDLATERVAAAVQAARALPFAFTLTGRTDACLYPHPSLEEVIRRLQAFERAGADALFAPGLPDLDAVRAVCSALAKPFNFMVGIREKSFTVAELEAAGVRRISLSTSLYRAAMTGLVAAAREARENGTFAYLDHAMATSELLHLMEEGKNQ